MDRRRALGSAPVLGWSAMLLLMLSGVTVDYPSISAEYPDGCDGWMHPCGVGPGLLSEVLFAVAGLFAMAAAVMLMAGVVARVADRHVAHRRGSRH